MISRRVNNNKKTFQRKIMSFKMGKVIMVTIKRRINYYSRKENYWIAPKKTTKTMGKKLKINKTILINKIAVATVIRNHPIPRLIKLLLIPLLVLYLLLRRTDSKAVTAAKGLASNSLGDQQRSTNQLRKMQFLRWIYWMTRIQLS